MLKQRIISERDVIKEILEIYKKLSYLWNPTHRLYTIKNARQQGYKTMLKSLRKIEPNATVATLKKKLENLRAAYRRERLKVLRSTQTAVEPDEIHKPHLWYYDYLTFLHDDRPVLVHDDSQDDEIVLFDNDDGDEQVVYDDETNDCGDDEANTSSVKDNLQCSDDPLEEDDEDEIEIPIKKNRTSKKRKSRNERKTQEQIPSSPETYSFDENSKTSAYLYGRTIGSQLQELSSFQRCLAEKLMSEIMFYAKLEQLTISTTVNLGLPDESNE